MAKYRAVSTGSYGLKEETHYLYYASCQNVSVMHVPKMPQSASCSDVRQLPCFLYGRMWLGTISGHWQE